MMPDEHCDQTIRLGAAGHRVLERVVTSTGAARVGFLVGVQLGIYEESVLEIVYADLRRFLISDRAQMARDLEAPLVRLLDRGAQFLTGDVLVGLERGRAAIRPVGHGLTCILRSGDLMHLEISIIAGPVQIGAGDVQMWARNNAALDVLLELQVRIMLDTARSAHGRHAARQIQPRRRELHLQSEGPAVEAALGYEIASRHLEQMV